MKGPRDSSRGPFRHARAFHRQAEHEFTLYPELVQTITTLESDFGSLIAEARDAFAVDPSYTIAMAQQANMIRARIIAKSQKTSQGAEFSHSSDV